MALPKVGLSTSACASFTDISVLCSCGSGGEQRLARAPIAWLALSGELRCSRALQLPGTSGGWQALGGADASLHGTHDDC